MEEVTAIGGCEFVNRPLSRRQARETPVELINDARLNELAREPVRELFPAARQAAVRRPFVALLAFLPGLVMFWNPSVDEPTAEHGLRALDVVAEESVWDWIATASQRSSANQTPVKPLATLLTALGLKLELFAPASRLFFASYVSSVFLLFCVGGLAKKLGGNRFAILVVLLASGHREFLALNNGLPPVALPLAFAMLSFRGMLAHQSAVGSRLTWALAGSGVSLAACSLSGGELAIGAWFVLLVQSVLNCNSIASEGERTPFPRWIGQCLIQAVMNLLGLLIVTAVGFVVFLGWQLAFSDGFDIRATAWRWSSIPGLWPTNSRGALAAQSFLTASGALLGFVLLGAMKLARGGPLGQDDAAARGRCFLVGWLGVAGVIWWMTWSTHGGEFTNAVVWPGFFLLSLLFLAAWGLEALLIREYGLGSVLIVVFVTVAVLWLPFWPSQFPRTVSGQTLTKGFLLTAGVVLVGVWLHRRIAEIDHRRRVVLISCVALMIVLDISNALRSRPPLSDDERELAAFRRQLMQETPPSACWLVSDGPSPARLQFFWRSLWPGVKVQEARGDELIAANPWANATRESGQSAMPTKSKGSFAIVVTWGSPRLPGKEWRRRGQMLTQSAAPHFLQGRPLKAYRWSLRPSPPLAQ